MFAVPLALIIVALASDTSAVLEWAPVTLRGSPEAMAEQHRIALEDGLPFFESMTDIRRALADGDLVHIPLRAHYGVADFVDPPYIHPDVLPFIDRTAQLYREACGEPLVVTSAVRAIENQPPNAHRLSVHPAGIAVDFRVSQTDTCRQWLEQKLLDLEEINVLNATRERSPPHYHVAVYPAPYSEYTAANPLPEPPAPPPAPAQPEGEPDRGSPWWIALGGVILIVGGGYLLMRRVHRTG